MRLNLILLTTIITAGTFLISCKKDDPEPTGSPTPVFSQSFSVTLDGQNISIPETSFNTSVSGNDITIYASKNKHLFNIYLRDTLQEGFTYPFEEGGQGQASIIYRDTNNMFFIFESQSGSMTITHIDTTGRKVQGTFSGVLKENFSDSTHSVTNGQFSVRY